MTLDGIQRRMTFLSLDILPPHHLSGLPWSSVGKESACNTGEPSLISGLGRPPGERIRLPTPVFWPREFHGLHSPQGHKELDTTERLSLYHLSRPHRPILGPYSWSLISPPLNSQSTSHVVYGCSSSCLISLRTASFLRTESKTDSFLCPSVSYLIFKCLVAQSCNCMDCNLPGSSVHEIFQTRILEWVSISFFRGSSRLKDWTRVSYVTLLAGGFFISKPPEKPLISNRSSANLPWMNWKIILPLC